MQYTWNSSTAASANPAREEPAGAACENYQIDLTGETYGICKCGHSRAAHLYKREPLRKWATSSSSTSFKQQTAPSSFRNSFSARPSPTPASNAWNQKTSASPYRQSFAGSTNALSFSAYNSQINGSFSKIPASGQSSNEQHPFNNSSDQQASTTAWSTNYNNTTLGTRQETSSVKSINNATKELQHLLSSREYGPGGEQYRELSEAAKKGIDLIFEKDTQSQPSEHSQTLPRAESKPQTVQHSTPIGAAWNRPQHAFNPASSDEEEEDEFAPPPPAPAAFTSVSNSYASSGYANGRSSGHPATNYATSHQAVEDDLFSPTSSYQSPQDPETEREKAAGKPCNNYQLDMLGKSFGVCKCGHSRASHISARAF